MINVNPEARPGVYFFSGESEKSLSLCDLNTYMMKSRFALLMLCVASVLACTKIEYVDRVVEEPSYPDLEGCVPDTVVATKARIQYYGAYSETVDRWYLTLFEKDGVEYIHEDDEYKGHGTVIILCLQTGISNGKESDIPVIAGMYTTPDSYSDLQPGQYEFGYDYPFDHPYKGIRYATYGTYVIDLDAAGYVPCYASDGGFAVVRNPDGSYDVRGLIVDTNFRKHYFTYSGPIQGVTEWDYYQAPNSSLKGNVTLTERDLPQIEIRKTELPFGSSKNIDAVRVYLTSNSVSVGPAPFYGVEKLSGSGAVAVLELIVAHGSSQIPAGTYTLAPRADGGYDGSKLTPFHFKEGMPNRYTNREGSWYFNLADSGLWTGDYAQFHGGSVSVSYAAGSSNPQIHAELIDCDTPAHTIVIDWK